MSQGRNAEVSATAVTDFLSAVNAGRISQQIVGQIVRLIHEGRLKPGDRLPPERDLAQRFGVSRVTVRDALRVLEVQGLLEVRMGASGGAFVTVPSTEVLSERLSELLTMQAVSVMHVVETRLVMELGIIDLVLVHATPEDVKALEDVCARSSEALAEGRYEPRFSNEFHARLAMATHNEAVEKVSMSFRGPLGMATVRAREGRAVAHARSVEDHTTIVDAIKQGDRLEARRRLAHHLSRNTDLRAFADELVDSPSILTRDADPRAIQ